METEETTTLVAKNPRLTSIQKLVLKSQFESCRLCGLTRTELRALYWKKGIFLMHHILTIDHKFPRSKGGTNEPWNIEVLCFKCNRMKADTLDLFEPEVAEELPEIV